MTRRLPPSCLLALAVCALAAEPVGAQAPIAQAPIAQAPIAQDALVPRLEPPASQTQPPPGFALSAREARRAADRTAAARDRFVPPQRARASAFIAGPGRWEVDYYEGARNVLEVDVDGRTGAVIKVYDGLQAESYLARGHTGGVADSAWVWGAFALVFVAPFFDPRRPLRLLHLDLLVLLGFGVSQAFFTQGDVRTSVPLVYPVLAYLLVRMLVAGLRPRRRPGPLVPLAPTALLVAALIVLVGARIAINLDHKVIDVGYASVVGADRIGHGLPLYVLNDVHGDTYGPIAYLAYFPFERVFPTHGTWDFVPAAHAAAIAFDLLTMLGLALIGMRLRAGRAGRRLGVALALAWAAYPYTLLSLATNTNDGLVAMLLVFALLALASAPVRGALLGLAAAAKFAPLALAPLFLRVRREGPGRWAVFAVALVVVVAFSVALYLPSGGLREFYDTTIGYQLGRYSPFSLWSQYPQLVWVQTALKAAAALLALALAFFPRRRDTATVAALGAAVLIATSLPATHWFYFYIVWFAPLALVALFAEHATEREGAGAADGADREPVRAVDRVPVAA